MIDRSIAAMLISVGALTGCSMWEGDVDCASSDPCDKATGPRLTTSSPASPGTAAPRDLPAAGTLVLRWRMTGGFAGVGGPGTVPEFSLYGDGRAIARDGARLNEYRLTRDGVRRLTAEAEAAGLDRPRTIGPEDVADAMILEITLNGVRTRVVQPEGQTTPVTRFWKRLDPEGWPPAERRGPDGPYRPLTVAVIAGEATTGGEVRTWPFKRALGGGEPAAGGICSVLSGADGRKAEGMAASAEPGVRWRDHGRTYSVRFRPLLPDESTCADVARA
ncbi:hypothetical protein [Spirillospora sp. NPDC047279]|uniref:hypothetical protein n=1 Tax=Spirillospora sp. NPDC047279 TaxID=3155478 RepID=UPI0033CDFDB6